MITLMSFIVAFLFAISLWYLSSNHKVTSVKPKATSLKLPPNLGWQWSTPASGTFVSTMGGTFQTDTPSTFESDTGCTVFRRYQIIIPTESIKILFSMNLWPARQRLHYNLICKFNFIYLYLQQFNYSAKFKHNEE